MRIIPTSMHGILDYIVGLLLIITPWLFGFNLGGSETWVTVVAGVVLLLQTLLTDFEPGLVKLIPMRIHLTMDFILGLILAGSPWLFNFDEVVWAPHVIIGLFAIAASLTTRTVPDYMTRRFHAHEHHINRT